MNKHRYRNAGESADVIDLNDDHQVRRWTELFEVTAEELTAAVRAVGPSPKTVHRYVSDRKYG